MNKVTVECAVIPEVDWTTSDARKTRFSNAREAVEVYRIRIPDHLPAMAGYYNLLSPDEVYRAGAYHHQRDAGRFVIGRAILRLLLAERSGTPAGKVRFLKSPDKKPYQLTDDVAAPKFNVTHAGDMILIAISVQDVGADIEYIDPAFGYDEVLDFAFSEPEKKHIRQAGSPRQAFYEIWSRKESLLKATGKGLGNNLAATQCLDGRNLVPATSIGSAENWLVRSFTASERYIGNISFSREAPVSFFDAEPGRFAK